MWNLIRRTRDPPDNGIDTLLLLGLLLFCNANNKLRRFIVCAHPTLCTPCVHAEHWALNMLMAHTHDTRSGTHDWMQSTEATGAEFNFPFEFSVGAPDGHDGGAVMSTTTAAVADGFVFSRSASQGERNELSLRWQKAPSQWKIATIFGREVNVTRSWKAVRYFQHVRMSNECDTCAVLRAVCGPHLHSHQLEVTQWNGIFLTICSGIYLQRPHAHKPGGCTRRESFGAIEWMPATIQRPNDVHVVSSTLHIAQPRARKCHRLTERRRRR